MSKNVTACVLIIGNEILSGRTQDINLKFLAEELSNLGVQVREARVIPDIEKTIIETLKSCKSTYDYVFTTGGIGPTHDDITAACVAKACGVELHRDPVALKLLEDHYSGTDMELTDARLKMADVPKGSILIDNPVSKAPGFYIDNIFTLAGVPKIAQAQFENLKHHITGGAPVLSKTISSQLREGDVAKALSEIQTQYEDVDIGSYPYFKDGNFGVSLVLRSQNKELLESCYQAVTKLINKLS